MLRYFVAPHHQDWDEHLAMAEFAINNSYQEFTKTTPFRLNVFKDPPTPLTLNRDARVPAAANFVDQMHQLLKDAKATLEVASQRQKKYGYLKTGSLFQSRR